MSDYKALIDELKEFTYWQGQSGPESRDIHPPICEKAANTIETLLAERNALLGALRGSCGDCVFRETKKCEEPCIGCCHAPQHFCEPPSADSGLSECWQWRGIGGRNEKSNRH